MQVSKWGNSVAVRLQAVLVEVLGLKEGDEIEIGLAGDRAFTVGRDRRRTEALDRLKALNWELPPGFKMTAARQMNGRFLDTNILVYAFLNDEAEDPRSALAKALIVEGGSISVQVMNEFAQVARRKLKRPWAKIAAVLDDFRQCFDEPLPLTIHTHAAALKIAGRDGFSFSDCLIIASALEAGCSILLSQDMRSGCAADGRLTIENPFVQG